jgi:hypothetical protein
MSVTAVRTLCVMLTIPALACGLISCSDNGDPNAWYNKTVVENFGGHTTPADGSDQPVAPGGAVVAAPPGTPVAAAGGPVVAAAGGPVVVPPNGPVPPGELYWSDTSCGALPLPPPPATTVGGVPAATAIMPVPTDITLQMTECDVARRSPRQGRAFRSGLRPAHADPVLPARSAAAGLSFRRWPTGLGRISAAATAAQALRSAPACDVIFFSGNCLYCLGAGSRRPRIWSNVASTRSTAPTR